eukprot:262197-Amphidinium_carterae.1
MPPSDLICTWSSQVTPSSCKSVAGAATTTAGVQHKLWTSTGTAQVTASSRAPAPTGDESCTRAQPLQHKLITRLICFSNVFIASFQTYASLLCLSSSQPRE